MGSIMKHLFRNIFIALCVHTGVVALFRTFARKNGALVRVLVFHDVRSQTWFEEVMHMLSRTYHLLTPEEFFQSQFDSKRINVLITFDDGYLSWVTRCLPALDSVKIQGLFFVNSGLLESYENTEAQNEYVEKRLLLTPRETLSWEGLRTLTHRGHTIGGHTTTHVRLSELQESMQRIEIETDKARIESVIGTPLRAFAYPFGQDSDYTEETQKLVSECGYTHAFTTEGVFANYSTPYTISRLCLEEGMSTHAVRYWVEGGYDVYHKIKKLCVG